jgi:hypothetical protein
LRKKVAKRAQRHFAGKTPQHRVEDKGPDFIKFRFNRYSKKYPVPMNTVITVQMR